MKATTVLSVLVALFLIKHGAPTRQAPLWSRRELYPGSNSS